MTSPLTSLIRTTDSRLTNIAKQLRRALDKEMEFINIEAFAINNDMHEVDIRRAWLNGSIREMLGLLKLIDKKIYGGKGE